MPRTVPEVVEFAVRRARVPVNAPVLVTETPPPFVENAPAPVSMFRTLPVVCVPAFVRFTAVPVVTFCAAVIVLPEATVTSPLRLFAPEPVENVPVPFCANVLFAVIETLPFSVFVPLDVENVPEELLKSMLPVLPAATERLLFCARTVLPFRLTWPLEVSNCAVDALKLNVEVVPPAVRVFASASTVLPFSDTWPVPVEKVVLPLCAMFSDVLTVFAVPPPLPEMAKTVVPFSCSSTKLPA